MKNYYDLIKEKIIDFDKMLLEKYYELGLNETECLVLLRLYQYQITVNNCLNTKEIVKKLSLSEDSFGEAIVNLVNKDFISIFIDDNDENQTLDKFSLDGAYLKLSYVLEDKESNDVDNEKVLEMKKIVSTLEEKLKKILSPLDKTTVKKWIYEYKYEVEVIFEEIEKITKRKNPTVNMIDRSLFSRTKNPVDTEKVTEVQQIFKKMYGKKTG